MLDSCNNADSGLEHGVESQLRVSFAVDPDDSTVYDNDESDASSIANSLNDLSICNDTPEERAEQQSAEDLRSVLAPTCTTDSVFVEEPLQAVSFAKDAEAIHDSTAIQAPSHSVEEHKMHILKKFTWEGPPPPPLDADQTAQLMMLSRNECPFCKTAHGSRGLRVPAFADDEIKEECMIAHLVRFHHEDRRATWVLNAKR
ncbi:unnamed protein product [Strongylus vulgaris]|uniref:Uncharacterized protein n=1 Tax=Strongylus vulgaris TaxID=40348 RepID=A0A3P7L2S4_STRVU|nr:unnamed protein product [Strongylus vulgaris]